MEIYEVATSPAITCRPHAAVGQVARLMVEHDVGAVIVVDDDDRLVGLITDRDLVVRGVARDLPSTTSVGTIMTRDVIRVLGSADFQAVSNQMAAWGVRRIPVTDADGTVRGMVTLDDLMLVISEDIGAVTRPVRRQVRAGRQSLPGPTGRPVTPVDLRVIGRDTDLGPFTAGRASTIRRRD